MGFAGALRRSELIGLDVDDVSEDGEGPAARATTLEGKPGKAREQSAVFPTAAGRRPVRCGPGVRGVKHKALPTVLHLQ
jgi:hypothetical protein